MLYIVGTQKEAIRLKELLPEEVFVEVMGTAKIIDETYGSDRDIFENDGGYICIVENDTDVIELNSKYEVDLYTTAPEYCTKASDKWLNVLIICNNEFAITVLLSTQTAVSERFCDDM
ncbi:MAG: hypothetical protein VB018_05905 [Lachnospiraceae bacterium]|nr:hypothetical protein [Lachnospiraceae bacterium]